MIILGTNSIKDTGYDVANSCRFNRASSDNLTKTPSGDGDRQKWTTSLWIKRSLLGSTQHIFTAGTYSESISIRDEKIYVQVSNNNTTAHAIQSNRLLRDISAWYHIVVACDTTQGTAANRLKLYVNGVEETSLALDQRSAITQNMSTAICGQFEHRFGIDEGSTDYYSGYIAEAVLIDGQQLAPDQFGEFDEDSGIWKPIDVSGLTFGTNGFYLDFEDSAALGDDVSGNGNDFTVNNLTAIDQSTDTCTNNFATGNPLVVIGNTGQTYADGNLTFNASGNNWTATNSTIGASQGKWYAEFKVVTLASSTGYGMVGITGTENITNGNFISTEANSVGLGLDYRGSGQTYLYSAGSSVQAAGVAFAAGAIIGLAVDMDNKKFYFSQNGTYLTVGGSVGDPTSGSTGTGALTIPAGIETFLFAVGGYSTSFKGTCNFGSPAYAISSGNTDGDGYGNFEYAVPSGYYALNTKNLAEYG